MSAQRELMSFLSGGWHRLKHGNPVPGFYPQTGAETVLVRGSSEVQGALVVTSYEIVVSDQGDVIGRYSVRAEEDAESIRRATGT